MASRIAACIGWLSVVAAPFVVACTGEVGGKMGAAGGGSSSTGGSVSTAGDGTMTQACTDTALASARLWRLTDAQYVNAVRQLFGVEVGPEVTEADTGAADYTNFSELTLVNDSIVASYQTAAQDVARQAVKSHFDNFLGCGTTDACVEQFIRNRVARAFGRRLDADEVSGYIGLYHKGAEQSPQDGVRLMIEATLQSPSFIYRTELGTPTPGGQKARFQLTPHEIAVSLSFSLTNSIPDEQLWAKADTGELAKPEVLAAEVDRMLDMPETKANLTNLGSYWLGVQKLRRTEKDTAKFPEFTTELKNAMYQSASMFVQDLLANGTVTDLVTSKKMYLNELLATTFGIPGVTGADFKEVTVTNPERGNGILSQPGVLAAYSRPTRGDPIHRGLFSFYALACGGAIPPPPPGALDVAKTFPADATERELAGLRAANAVCKACHGRFDTFGLLTERFDPIGRYHETDPTTGMPIDQSADVATLGADLDGHLDGVSQLTAKLTQGRRLSDCAAANLAVYTLGRDVKADTSCALAGVKESLAKTGKFRDFYKALVTSPAFIQRDVQ
jgi:hypothetical protein